MLSSSPPTSWLLLAVAVLPLIGAAVISVARPQGSVAARWAVGTTGLAATSALALLVVAALGEPQALLATTAAGEPLVGLRLDRITASLAVLTSGVGLVVISFAGRALDGDPRAPRFFALAATLTAATATMAVASTLVLFTLAWIVAGRALVALVRHRHTWAPAVRGAHTTSRHLAVGDLALVVATGLSVAAIGEVDLRAVDTAAAALAGRQVAGLPLLGVVALLVTFAGVSRSAIVPLHRWLPATIAAPTPVSAMLHAGVVNGAGVLLVTLAPIFGTSSLATGVLFVLALATVVYATAVMRTRSDVKGALAWSTAGQMGFMAVQLAVGAFAAAVFHLIGHGLYKAALFLGSGGAITARLRHHRRPLAADTVPTALRRAVSVGAPGVGLALAFWLIDPHLPAAGTVLIVVFAWATGARAVDGWLRHAPLTVAASSLLASAGAIAASLAYIGGLALVEGFVEPALPSTVDAAIGPGVLAGALAVLALAAIVVQLLPGDRGDRLRASSYALLRSSAGPRPPRRAATPAPTVSTSPRPAAATASTSSRASTSSTAAAAATPRTATSTSPSSHLRAPADGRHPTDTAERNTR